MCQKQMRGEMLVTFPVGVSLFPLVTSLIPGISGWVVSKSGLLGSPQKRQPRGRGRERDPLSSAQASLLEQQQQKMAPMTTSGALWGPSCDLGTLASVAAVSFGTPHLFEPTNIYIYIHSLYICMHIYIHIYLFIYLYTRTYTYIHTYIYWYICISVYMYIYICIYVHM